MLSLVDYEAAHAALSPTSQPSVHDGTYTVVMQAHDGDLVIYGPAGAAWSSRIWGHPGANAVMQGDGNLVVYDLHGRPLFNTATAGQPRAFATLWYNGDLIVWSAQFAPLWGS